MNERIEKLALQAGMTDDKFGMFFAKDKHNEDGVDLEKFAELIVQDIDKIVDDLYHVLPLEQAAVLLTLDENIKEHFYGSTE